MKRTKEERKIIRHYRIRKKVTGTTERPRVCVHKTLKHIYAAAHDDCSKSEGCVTLVSVTTNTKANKASGKSSFCNIENAKIIGANMGNSLKEKGITSVVFDRAGYRYHGCVKALAEALRKTGINI
jgi:large subunit ribosomal protein L18